MLPTLGKSVEAEAESEAAENEQSEQTRRKNLSRSHEAEAEILTVAKRVGKRPVAAWLPAANDKHFN